MNNQANNKNLRAPEHKGRPRRRLGHALTAVTVCAGIVAVPATVSASERSPTCMGRLATIIGTSGNDVIRGTSGNDVIWAGAGNDKITGSGGRDIICGGPGNDMIRVGVKNDVGAQITAEGDSGNDRIYGGAGADYIDGGSGKDKIFGGAGNDSLDGGKGADRLKGGSGADILRGNGGNDVLEGGKDPDSLDGGSGNDHLIGGADALDPRLQGGSGDDYISTGTRAKLTGKYGARTVEGGSGNDVLYGSRSAEYFSGDNGDDLIHTGRNSCDSVRGGNGDDTIVAIGCPNNTQGVVEGDAGNDSILSDLPANGGPGNDLVVGGRSETYYNGNEGHDVVDSGPGRDTTIGGDGDDLLIGGSDKEWKFDGRAGRDTCLHGSLTFNGTSFTVQHSSYTAETVADCESVPSDNHSLALSTLTNAQRQNYIEWLAR